MRSPFLSLASVALLFVSCAHEQTITTPRLAILNQQVAANANDAQAYANRGYALALLGQKEAARADLRRSVLLKNNSATHNGAGWAYFNLGDYATALHEWQIAAEMSHHSSHYDHYSLALGYWGVGDKKNALENYQSAVEREPRFGTIKTLQERTAEWTPRERDAIEGLYALWSKTWRQQ